jgi:hypothetical protein
MNIPKVTNMTSPRTGKPVANQFLITIDSKPDTLDKLFNSDDIKIYFQSYNSNIAVNNLITDEIILDVYYWDYSVTTSKYLNMFLGNRYGKKETQQYIDSGKYKLANLNG